MKRVGGGLNLLSNLRRTEEVMELLEGVFNPVAELGRGAAGVDGRLSCGSET